MLWKKKERQELVSLYIQRLLKEISSEISIEYEYEHFVDTTKNNSITFDDYTKITMDSWPKLDRSERIAYCTFKVAIVMFIILFVISGILDSGKMFVFTLLFPVVSFAITILAWKFRDNKIHKEYKDKLAELASKSK